MKYKTLGKTGFKVSEICFGCSELRADGEELVREAYDMGINFFDTADVYGEGISEETLGKVVRPFRHRVRIATKVGMYPKTWEPHGGEKHFIKSCEESLKRLKTDYIDLYQVHCYSNPDSTRILKKLQKQGKIIHFGISNYGIDKMKEDPCLEDIATHQIRFNFLQQEMLQEVGALCAEHDIAMTAYSPLCKGLMTGKFKGDEIFPEGDIRYKDKMFEGDAFKNNITRVADFLNSIRKEEESATQATLRWIREQGLIPIMGARTKEQVKDNASIT